MNTLRWMTWLKWLGCATTILVIAWWTVVFYYLSQQTGNTLLDYLSCLYAPTENCNMLRGMAWLRGINPYEPLAFWWAISVAGLARCAENALKNNPSGQKEALIRCRAHGGI